ncbi:MAG: host attachment protein, partial [Gammaproteobacteria bacterium]|nr:host attachment protein [Gammaproteobacteria bacterium]
NILVVAADTTCARIFKATSSKGPLEEKEVLVHPENRLSEKDLISDGKGSTFSSHGSGRCNYSKHSDVKDQGTKEFINEINDCLMRLEANNEFKQLIIIAAPKLLGALKKQLNSGLQKRITYELNKNIVKLNADEIRSHLPKYLALTDL